MDDDHHLGIPRQRAGHRYYYFCSELHIIADDTCDYKAATQKQARFYLSMNFKTKDVYSDHTVSND